VTQPPIDVEYVELRAKGARDAARDIERMLREIQRDVERAADAIERDFEESFGEVEASAHGMSEFFSREAVRQRKTWRSVAQALALDFEAGAETAQAAVDDMADHMERDLDRVRRKAFETAAGLATAGIAGAAAGALPGGGAGGAGGGILSGIGGALGDVGGALGQLGGFAVGKPLLSLLLALVPAILAVGGALGDLIGLVGTVPAGLSILVAAIIPLVLAFHGLGEAMSAIVATNDPAKIRDALKGIAPAAGEVLLELKKLLKPLGDLQKAVQQAFFLPLRGVFTEVVAAALPTLTKGLTSVASALGKVGAEFLRLLAANDILEDIANIFESTARITAQFGPSIVKLFGIMFGFAEHGLPFVERFFAFLSRGIDRLGNFSQDFLSGGGFDRFVEDAIAALKSILNLAGALWDLLKAVFGDAGDEGRAFLDVLSDIIRDLAQFLESDVGKEFLQNILDLLPVLAGSLALLVDLFKSVAVQVNLTFRLFAKLKEWVIAAWHAIVDFGKAVADLAVRFGRWVATGARAVGDFFTKIPGWVGGALSAIGDFVSDVADRVIGFLTSLPERALNALKALGVGILAAVKLAGDTVIERVGEIIGLVLFAFFSLPRLIGDALRALPGLLFTFFTNLWATVRDLTVRGLNAAVEFIAALPGRVATFITNLWNTARDLTIQGVDAVISFVAGLRDRAVAILVALPGIVAGFFVNLWNTARALTIQGVESVIAFVQSVPGRFVALVGRFVDAGRRLITGLFDGLKSGAGAASDLGRAIAESVRGFLNNIITKLNDGIANIDKKLPGPSLPRIPMLAGGGMATSFVVAGIGEGGRSEVVLPLEDPRTMAKMREGLGRDDDHSVVFEAGAIQVIFSGVVPTRAEAEATGEVISETIGKKMANGDARLRVRMAAPAVT